MKIGILAPLKRELSLDTKGGRPRIVYNVVEELVRRGHEVTVFGTGDSKISAHLIAIAPEALYHLPQVENEFYRHMIYLSRMMQKMLEYKDSLDIVHNHLYPEVLPLLFANQINAPMLTTIHTQMTEDLGTFFSQYPHTYFSPISDQQKSLYPGLNYTQTVYNGIDESEFSLLDKPKQDSYLLFVGRIREFVKDLSGSLVDPKGVTDAIRIAQKTKQRLKIVGNVESFEFFKREIKPHLSETIEFIGNPHSIEGSLSLHERVKLYQKAKALVLPVHWEEPFGIVMIEAMSCGTPVIGYRRGAIPEVIIDGETGFVVDTEEEFANAVLKIGRIDRLSCRQLVEQKFTIKKMVDGYEKIYLDLRPKA